MKLELRFESDTRELRRMRNEVRAFLVGSGVPEMDAELVVLALDEACANIIRHAYQGDSERPIRLRCDCSGDAIECVLRDFGTPCDPAKIRGRDLQDFRPGGLGVRIMQKAFDCVDFQPKARGTELRLIKRRKPTGQ
jgi:anti-sigma regulatory factor (Ser/Thr protein kinase)